MPPIRLEAPLFRIHVVRLTLLQSLRIHLVYPCTILFRLPPNRVFLPTNRASLPPHLTPLLHHHSNQVELIPCFYVLYLTSHIL